MHNSNCDRSSERKSRGSFSHFVRRRWHIDDSFGLSRSIQPKLRLRFPFPFERLPRRLTKIPTGPTGKIGALSIQPKVPVISVGTSNGTDHFGLVRPEYSGPALKVVHCDRSGHFGRSDRNVPFHLPKLLSPVPLFSILLTRPSSFQWKVKCCE